MDDAHVSEHVHVDRPETGPVDVRLSDNAPVSLDRGDQLIGSALGRPPPMAPRVGGAGREEALWCGFGQCLDPGVPAGRDVIDEALLFGVPFLSGERTCGQNQGECQRK